MSRGTRPPAYTAGIPAVDHHSHAGYIRPGERVEGIDALEREYAMGHVEANVPHDVYAAYTAAVLAGDAAGLERLDREHGISALIEQSVRFQATTVHAVSLAEGSRALYGDLSREETIRASRDQRVDDFPGLYDRALRLTDTAAVLTDIPAIDGSAWPHARYKPIARIDPYLAPFGRAPYTGRGADTPRFQRIFATVLATVLADQGLEAPPATLDEYVEFIGASISARQAAGFVGLKIASAYVRTLRFERVPHEDAAAIYRAFARGEAIDARREHALGDYLVFAIAELAAARGLPIQIHTGMGHTEPGLRLTNADPRNLESLIGDPALNRLKVVLIHGGYPYTSSLAAISQAHGNVFVDFSWMPYLQHHTLGRLLQEWLEMLPANKVMFGTDTGQPEFHVAATSRSRRALDGALDDGVRDGLWTLSQAEHLARRVLHQNLCDVYGVTI